MKEVIIIIRGLSTHYYNPELGDFTNYPCECPHSLLEEAEAVKTKNKYKGDIELSRELMEEDFINELF
jgi:hypothetical protein